VKAVAGAEVALAEGLEEELARVAVELVAARVARAEEVARPALVGAVREQAAAARVEAALAEGVARPALVGAAREQAVAARVEAALAEEAARPALAGAVPVEAEEAASAALVGVSPAGQGNLVNG
jgi:hypothetical protein